MPTFKLIVAYDGTGLVGWQRQASGISVQGLLEEALAELDGKPVTVTGAGRTDAGVHALGQVASASLARSIDGRSLARALNSQLPAAVRVIDASLAPADFHPRFDARSKTYRYRIWNTDVASPFERAYAWHIASPTLEIAAMRAAASVVLGRHDFAAFQSTGSDTATTEREVTSCCVAGSSKDERDDCPLVTCEVTGDGFLRHMVRALVGTLVEVGRGKRPPEWLAEVLRSADRAAAGPTAPAEGLFLVHVEYGEYRDDSGEACG